jgi:DNA-directed RNA polymerase specialized sigma24 family protein
VCIEMRFQDDLRPQAISDRVGVALETIKKRLLRAKQKLLLCMESKLQLNAFLEN